MKISVTAGDPLNVAADVLVLGVAQGATVRKPPLAGVAATLGPSVGRMVKRHDFSGKKDQSLDLQTHGNLRPARVLLLGMGPEERLTSADVRLLAARGARAATAGRATSITVAVPDGIEGAMRAAAEGVVLGAYRFSKYMTGDRVPKFSIERATLVAPGAVKPALREAATAGQRVAESICIARDLINEPPNELYPDVFARRAVEVAKAGGLKVTVFDDKELERRGMHLILAVGRGSARKPRLVHMTYTPAQKTKKRLAFVGKGLTFDSGGLCIKPAPGMEEMKGDMGGAANVVALMAAVAALKPPVEVHGILGLAENMPDGDAYRPADIFRSLDGKTVEIINTDAEGRLVLADALTYARGLSPDVVLDNATLTGACVVALGPTVSGYYASSEELAARFGAAVKAAGEQMWHMPLVEDLRENLKSEWADLKHTGDRWGGSITAALFLREFVGDVPWIHVDIAGPSMASRPYHVYTKGGTGHGVLTYLEFIEAHARG